MSELIVSDIGSFPKNPRKAGMRATVEDIMGWKIRSGLDVPLYPQTRDMVGMFFGAIAKSRDWIAAGEKARVAEVAVVERFARARYEKTGERLELGVCITGPVELYAAKAGYIFDEGLLLNLAKSVNRFARNSEIRAKHCKTALISLDEPSFGVNPQLQYEGEWVRKALEVSFRGVKCLRQLHLHAAAENGIAYSVRNLDVIGVEAAENPRNLLLYEKRELARHDKFLRVGIARSNVFAIESEARKAVGAEVVNRYEGVAKIRGRYRAAKKMFGDRLLVVGPDCGLGAWKEQGAAYQLLANTVKAVRG